MGLVMVALLVVLWAWILVPGAVRERRSASPSATVSRFERSMARLARTNRGGGMSAKAVSGRYVWVLDRPDAVVHGDARRRAARRRRSVLRGLTVATTLSLVGATIVGGVFVAAVWISSVLLVVFLGLLLHRWIRVSREEAAPLVGSPAPQTVDLAAGWRVAQRQAGGPAVETHVDHDAVRVIDW